jgi:hypothetical protein
MLKEEASPFFITIYQHTHKKTKATPIGMARADIKRGRPF